MPRQRLTLQRIATFKPAGEGFLWDEEVPWLAVRARASGAKSFIFKGTLNYQAIRLTIGSVDAWTIEAARDEARRYQKMIEDGKDPREVLRQQEEARAAEEAAAKAAIEAARRAAEDRQKYTLRALCMAYADHLKAKGRTKTSVDVRSAFRVHVIEAHPDIADVPAREVTSHQIAAVVRKVREAGKERTAGILRNYLVAAFNTARKAPFDSGVTSDMIKFEITTNPAEIIPTIPVRKGERNLSADELREYLQALGDDATDRALLVCLLIGGQRKAQLLRAKVSDYDPEAAILRLLDGKGRRTAAREHLVPVGPRAAAVIKELIAARTKQEDLLFGVSERTVGNRLSAISKALQGAPFDLRDLRRTAETALAKMGISKDLRGQLLSHGISGVQDAHYDKHDYLDEKRAALLAWEARLEEIQTGQPRSNVVLLRA